MRFQLNLGIIHVESPRKFQHPIGVDFKLSTYVLFDQKPVHFYLKITERAATIQVSLVDFRSILKVRNNISFNIILPYKNKITIDYEISYFGFDFDRKLTKET